jgi:enoyl-CoA hydratase
MIVFGVGAEALGHPPLRKIFRGGPLPFRLLAADLRNDDAADKCVHPGGMIAGLAARIPHKVAMEMMLLGEPMAAQRAYEVGLANRIVPAGSEVKEAVAMAEKIVDLAPLALAAMKRFVNDGVLPMGPAELAARYGTELAAVRNSEDAAEGVRAFRERRRPRYQGR